MMIVSARPMMNPFSTGSEMKVDRKPRRKSPVMSATTPVTTASAAVSVTYRAASPPAKRPTVPAESAAVADIGATMRCRELPSTA